LQEAWTASDSNGTNSSALSTGHVVTRDHLQEAWTASDSNGTNSSALRGELLATVKRETICRRRGPLVTLMAPIVLL
jgi:hypothetical protein